MLALFNYNKQILEIMNVKLNSFLNKMATYSYKDTCSFTVLHIVVTGLVKIYTNLQILIAIIINILYF